MATPPPHPAYRVTARISIPAPIPFPPLPPIPSPSLPLSPPLPVSALPPASPIHTPSSGTPPLLLPSTNRREDKPEVTLPPRKRLGIALGPTYEVRENSSFAAARLAGGLRADYDEIVEAMQGTPVVTDVAEFSQRMTEFETKVRQDLDEIDGDYRDAGGRSLEAEAVYKGTKADKGYRLRCQSYRDSRDPLMVWHSQSYQRRLVAVPRSCHG
ncbi:hypothetical protein Tco_1512983 [Tanacetum coccineum]